jgi:hypothetical protein
MDALLEDGVSVVEDVHKDVNWRKVAISEPLMNKPLKAVAERLLMKLLSRSQLMLKLYFRFSDGDLRVNYGEACSDFI